MKREQYLQVYSELLSSTESAPLCEYDERGNLIKIFGEGNPVFNELFMLNECKKLAWEYAENSDKPVLLNDNLGMTWITAPHIEDSALRSMYVLGPFFTAPISKSHIEKLLAGLNISFSLKQSFFNCLLEVPIRLFLVLLDYGVNLYYVINGKKITSAELRVHHEKQQEPLFLENFDQDIKQYDPYAAYTADCALEKLVEHGTLTKEILFSTYQHSANIKTGVLANDPLRQAKNEIIVSSTIYSRAAIRGGLDVGLADALKNQYIQQVEACTKTNDVYVTAGRMILDFSNHVKSSDQYMDYSKAVRDCVGFIDNNIEKDIQLDEIASNIGYTTYYLTRKFKEEVGMKLVEYIKQQKVEHAKILLVTTQADIIDICEQLSFSTPSYFSATFKKYTGVSPSEYRNTRTNQEGSEER